MIETNMSFFFCAVRNENVTSDNATMFWNWFTMVIQEIKKKYMKEHETCKLSNNKSS